MLIHLFRHFMCLLKLKLAVGRKGPSPHRKYARYGLLKFNLITYVSPVLLVFYIFTDNKTITKCKSTMYVRVWFFMQILYILYETNSFKTVSMNKN